jgi:putative transposase
MNAATQLASEVGTTPACAAIGVARATFYRHLQVADRPCQEKPRPTPPRALSAQERRSVLDTLHSERFVDQAPAEVYATLLDEGRYLCSIRTMYRLLDAAQEVRERRDQLRHPQYHKPELLATGPNQVWSWDITKLLGPAKLVVLLSVRHHGHLQPLRGGLDVGAAGKRPVGPTADPRDVRQREHR